jgi:glycine/D-amino acid oxidase-like deaminating enzyme
MRIAIVGGGIAGAALAWRLASRASVTVFLGAAPPTGDATGASGGLVRGFDTDPDVCRAAAESLAELLASPALRARAGYRQVGSVYLTMAGERGIATVDEILPGSAVALTAAELTTRYPFRLLPAATVGVVESRAGYLSPRLLRDALLDLAAAAGVTMLRQPVAGLTTAPAVRLADGTRQRYDAVVVAAGVWSAMLLATAGTALDGVRTKRIQYDLRRSGPPGLGAFVDETSGLYGRPTDDGGLLIGLPSAEWDLAPGAVLPDRALSARVAAVAQRRFGDALGDVRTIVAALDSYRDPPGLALRPAASGVPLFSFTGGSGGAAKTALAVSRSAAHHLLAVTHAA